MKNLQKVGLGILTSIGGYLEAGSIGTALQAGAAFRYGLLWALALGTICIIFLTEMTGRLAAVSHHTVVAAMRKRFGISFQIYPLTAQMIVDLLVLAAEVAGAALALEMLTGISMRVWAIPVALVIWALLWFATFSTIENGVAALGLVTLCFVVAAIRLQPDWAAAARHLVPRPAESDPMHYAYLAVGILGATISPYLVTFYSSGAVEEKWTSKELVPNRIVAGLGMGFGSLVAMSVLIVAALVLAPRGIRPETYQDAALVLTPALGRWGPTLFWVSLGIGCVGAALELALDFAYIVAQTFGWEWGEDQPPSADARFALTYSAAVAIAALPALIGLDPLALTMFSMAITVLALPLVVGPLVVIMNDKTYLRSHTNGPIANAAVVAIVVLAFVLAAVAIPVQLMGS
jgi:Mn2+/Fe2+ NRAMP family transporter